MDKINVDKITSEIKILKCKHESDDGANAGGRQDLWPPPIFSLPTTPGPNRNATVRRAKAFDLSPFSLCKPNEKQTDATRRRG